MLSERIQCPFQWYLLYVLIARDEQCGSGMDEMPRGGDDSLQVQDDVV